MANISEGVRELVERVQELANNFPHEQSEDPTVGMVATETCAHCQLLLTVIPAIQALATLEAPTESEGVRLTRANVAGYVKGFNAAQEYERTTICNRCRANLCEHDNCTDWTCARACSKCATLEAPGAAPLEFKLAQAKDLLEMFGGDETLITVTPHEGKLLAYATEYPDEGSIVLGEMAAAAPAEAEKRERDLCIQDIQDAIGDWGGPEREHYTQAMGRAIDAIKKRAQGLDLWGRPLDAAAPAPESQPPEPWNPEIESFDVALQRQRNYNAKLAKRVSEATEKEGSNG